MVVQCVRRYSEIILQWDISILRTDSKGHMEKLNKVSTSLSEQLLCIENHRKSGRRIPVTLITKMSTGHTLTIA